MTSALKLAPKGISVNTVYPGANRTYMIAKDKFNALPKQIPLNRVGEPEDVV
jgi:NAD(P)-dependent dehydrogenase (short-subunit alcohol dehydrogenase family)